MGLKQWTARPGLPVRAGIGESVTSIVYAWEAGQHAMEIESPRLITRTKRVDLVPNHGETEFEIVLLVSNAQVIIELVTGILIPLVRPHWAAQIHIFLPYLKSWEYPRLYTAQADAACIIRGCVSRSLTDQSV